MDVAINIGCAVMGALVAWFSKDFLDRLAREADSKQEPC